jgi:hypothetical protein
MGDFNEVLRQEEHEGVGQRTKAHMDGFRDAVDVCGLQDLGYVGRTWTFEKWVADGSFYRVRFDRASPSDTRLECDIPYYKSKAPSGCHFRPWSDLARVVSFNYDEG